LTSSVIIIETSQVPELDDYNDPKYWIRTYAKKFILAEDEHPLCLRVDSEHPGYRHVNRNDIDEGDVVQVRITFEPYYKRTPTKGYVCGVRLNMHEIMVIRDYRYTERVPLQVNIDINIYVHYSKHLLLGKNSLFYVLSPTMY